MVMTPVALGGATGRAALSRRLLTAVLLVAASLVPAAGKDREWPAKAPSDLSRGAPADRASAAGASDPVTPAPGSPDRKAIFDALRMTQDIDRVFVPSWFKVMGGYAFVIANGQSRDGRNHYEPETALLRREAGGWRVIDMPCSEDGCEPTTEIVRIRKAWPGAPAAIFPNF